jgi:hypothetical protein
MGISHLATTEHRHEADGSTKGKHWLRSVANRVDVPHDITDDAGHMEQVIRHRTGITGHRWFDRARLRSILRGMILSKCNPCLIWFVSRNLASDVIDLLLLERPGGLGFALTGALRAIGLLRSLLHGCVCLSFRLLPVRLL